MSTSEALRLGDAAVVARYLQVRSTIHDRFLPRIERLVQAGYEVEPTRRLHSTLVAQMRGGFVRPGEGELWPVFFMTTVDLSIALCVELSAARVASLGTMLNGPRRLRHRSWEEWYGWEQPLAEVHPEFYRMEVEAQEEALVRWFREGLEWLAGAGLLRTRREW